MGNSTQAYLTEAVHHHRATSRRGIMERLFTLWFRGFVYNQIWEDPRVDAAGLELDNNSRLLTISSGGCNVLNYLIHSPERVVAVDLNRAHMALTRLKIAGLRHLPDYESFYAFFGEGKGAENVKRYAQYIQPHLDAKSRKFWESSPIGVGRNRIEYFSKGIYNYGRMGRFFRFLHLVARVTGMKPAEFLKATSIEEQERYFDQYIAPFFDNRLVRWAGKLPLMVYSLGIPPSQHDVMFDESEGNVIPLYKERIRKLTCDFSLDDNYFAWQAFSRSYNHEGRQPVPDYLKEEHYALLRENIDRVETHQSSYIEYLKAQPDNSLDSFILLDAQDWMPEETLRELWGEMARVGVTGARVIFRTAGEHSPIEAILNGDLGGKFLYLPERSRHLNTYDRSAIYGMFHIYIRLS